MKPLAMLFDMSFSEFLTTRFIRSLYALAIVINGLVAFIVLVALALSGDGVVGKLGMLFLAVPLSVLVFLGLTAVTRIAYELIIVLFRIAENVQSIERNASLIRNGRSEGAF
jgi:hypothetical protein